ncbi:hypothetical protein SH449x_002634 [Pirellulaceae bacterium SH449]
MSPLTQAVTLRADQALIRVIRASPAAPVVRARVNPSRVSPNQVNQNPASLNRATQIHHEQANRIRATPVTANRTAQATQDHPVVAIPARANRAEATAVIPIVWKVNRLARKARASRKVNRIPTKQAAKADRYQVTRGLATRSPVTPVAAGLPRRVNPAKARVNRKASRKANQVANRDQRASHQAAMVQKADPAAIDQVTAKVKAIASHGRPATPPADLAAIRRAALAADQRAVLAVTHRHRQAIRMIHRQVTHTIHLPASRIVRA